jgi:multisubunit Na+/H+ antiporter MnhB subunit
VEQARQQAHALEHQHGWIRDRLDLFVAVLLGLSVMAIAWGAYQAEVKSKDADHYFNRSDETLGTAHKLQLEGDQEVATYEQLFLEYERERVEGHGKAVAVIKRRLLSPSLRSAIEWWQEEPLAQRPVSPFVDANPEYKNGFYDRARGLETLAALNLKKAHKAEERVIDYTLVSVILTVALFLLGISTQFPAGRVKLGLLAFGGLIFLGSIGRFIDLAVA